VQAGFVSQCTQNAEQKTFRMIEAAIMVSRKMIEYSLARSKKWDVGNKVLYDLCLKYPKHNSDDEIIAKMWLIGRSYAAAIERSKHIEKIGDDFYVNRVAPIIRRSKIDEWLRPLQAYKRVTPKNVEEIVAVHKNVTDLFYKISKLDKRSLASKYLHFHHPSLFFIYDSRACMGMRKFSAITGRASRGTVKDADNEYRKLTEKCLLLQSYIKKTFDVVLTPRQIDKLLLYADKRL
jgi:hypothetical protein